VATTGGKASVAPVLTREREMRREEASDGTEGERENRRAREEINRRKRAPQFSQI
jgi:hypothetical protein